MPVTVLRRGNPNKNTISTYPVEFYHRCFFPSFFVHQECWDHSFPKSSQARVKWILSHTTGPSLNFRPNIFWAKCCQKKYPTKVCSRWPKCWPPTLRRETRTGHSHFFTWTGVSDWLYFMLASNCALLRAQERSLSNVTVFKGIIYNHHKVFNCKRFS